MCVYSQECVSNRTRRRRRGKQQPKNATQTGKRKNSATVCLLLVPPPPPANLIDFAFPTTLYFISFPPPSLRACKFLLFFLKNFFLSAVAAGGGGGGGEMESTKMKTWREPPPPLPTHGASLPSFFPGPRMAPSQARQWRGRHIFCLKCFFTVRTSRLRVSAWARSTSLFPSSETASVCLCTSRCFGRSDHIPQETGTVMYT